MRMEDYSRFKLSPKSAAFWGAFNPNHSEAKKGAKAIHKCFRGLSFDKKRITRQELHEFYDEMCEVAGEWEHLGLNDSEMREAFFVLVGRKYKLPYSDIHRLYYGFNENEKGLLVAIGRVNAAE